MVLFSSIGGVSALVAALMLKPRKGRFTPDDHYHMESPVGAILGLFILWLALFLSQNSMKQIQTK